MMALVYSRCRDVQNQTARGARLAKQNSVARRFRRQRIDDTQQATRHRTGLVPILIH